MTQWATKDSKYEQCVQEIEEVQINPGYGKPL